MFPETVVTQDNDYSYLPQVISNRTTILNVKDLTNDQLLEKVYTLSPDLIVCAGYNKILSRAILQIPKFGGLNCHAGQLPTYRGASPIPWQIINGETAGTAYILKMTPYIDDGPIYAQQRYFIEPSDDATSITTKVNQIFRTLLPDTVGQFLSGEFPKSKTQNAQGAITWTKRQPDDGVIHWNQLKSHEVINLVRGLTHPYPGAYTFFGRYKLTIHKAVELPQRIKGVPGRYIGTRCGYPAITTADHAIGVLKFSLNDRPADTIPFSYGWNSSTKPAHTV